MAVEKVTKTAAAKHLVMLGNGCHRYHRDGVMYESDKKYEVTDKQREKLFDCVDDNGVRYFYDADVLERQRKAQEIRRRKQSPDSETGTMNGEIDTGIVRLRDTDGGSVGTKGSEGGDSVEV